MYCTQYASGSGVQSLKARLTHRPPRLGYRSHLTDSVSLCKANEKSSRRTCVSFSLTKAAVCARNYGTRRPTPRPATSIAVHYPGAHLSFALCGPFRGTHKTRRETFAACLAKAPRSKKGVAAQRGEATFTGRRSNAKHKTKALCSAFR